MKQLTILALLFSQLSLFAQSPELIFHSGFEPNTTTNDESSSSVDLIGIDASVSAPNDWENDLDDHPNIGSFKIQYQGGDETERLALIAPDPENPSNSTLQFWIVEPNSGNNGRIQGNLYGNNGLYKLFYSVRLYLPADFNVLKNAPFDFRFLTLMEFWNNANWTDEDYMFRIKVNLAKVVETADSLHIRAAGQMRGSGSWGDYIWDVTNTDFVVPVQKWMTLKVYFVEGDACTGRFRLSITPDGEPETIVHDIKDFTHHPDNPNPDGLSHFNPIKLYTSDETVEYMTGAGGLLNVFWDDFELWKDSVLLTGNACFPNGVTFDSQEQIDDFGAGAPPCTSINGDVIIRSGASDVTNLNGLSQLNSIQGVLRIESNNALTSLSGLGNLDFNCVTSLEIINNSNLAVCNEVNVCNYLGDGGAATIMNNASGCNNIMEVQEDCIYADNDNDGYNSSVDCDDENPDINPGATEIPNNGIDEDCDGSDLTTSTIEIEKSEINIFPNPTNGFIEIRNYDSNVSHIQIRDFAGKLILQKDFRDHQKIDLNDFSNGIYIISIKTETTFFVEKIVKI
jgi:Secretion system C-terminal sorting domain/Putative metal-binding motif